MSTAFYCAETDVVEVYKRKTGHKSYLVINKSITGNNNLIVVRDGYISRPIITKTMPPIINEHDYERVENQDEIAKVLLQLC